MECRTTKVGVRTTKIRALNLKTPSTRQHCHPLINSKLQESGRSAQPIRRETCPFSVAGCSGGTSNSACATGPPSILAFPPNTLLLLTFSRQQTIQIEHHRFGCLREVVIALAQLQPGAQTTHKGKRPVPSNDASITILRHFFHLSHPLRHSRSGLRQRYRPSRKRDLGDEPERVAGDVRMGHHAIRFRVRRQCVVLIIWLVVLF